MASTPARSSSASWPPCRPRAWSGATSTAAPPPDPARTAPHRKEQEHPHVKQPARRPPTANLAPEHALRRLELKVVRRLDGLLRGEHLGLLPGHGSEPAEARVYQPGEDDVRMMDWHVTARTTVPHVRDMIADRELETWALLDLSASMDFGTAHLEKRDLAVSALAAIGFLTARLGDRFGADVLHSGGIRRFRARSGKPALYALLQSVLNAPRTEHGAPDPDPDLAAAMQAMARSRPKRGLRVIVSDFIEPRAAATEERPWERPLRQIAARHQVLAVEILDPRELDLPDVGTVVLTDTETGAEREVHLNADVRRRYLSAARGQRLATQRALRRCGVPHLVLRTDSDWVLDIARFVMEQRRVAHRLLRHTPGRPR
ncbi:MAG: DUF58 domain-containing protein [Streptosporangiales bacterium]|nr:DUF58 domain-containing protein [Streptosporangiales bacterium]